MQILQNLLLGHKIITRHFLWADGLLSTEQKSQPPSSVYTSQRKGAQLSLGTESSSLMRPLKTAHSPSLYYWLSVSSLLGNSWGNTCSLFVPTVSILSYQSIHLLSIVQKFLKTSGLLMILFHVSCHLVENMGGIRGKCMCLVYMCARIHTFEKQIQ